MSSHEKPPDESSSWLRKVFVWSKSLGSGIVLDIRARVPWYISDWKDAWNYRVVPATALIFFANILPGIAFSLDLIETTAQYGVAEVLLSSFMAAFMFSIFGAQPLTIAGVTGPITVFNKTIFDILEGRDDSPDYLHFIGWVYLWAAIIHWITASLNWCNFLKYVTLFSCDTFGFYVSWVYLQYGIQVTTRQLQSTDPPNISGALVGIILALLMLITSFLSQSLSQKTFFHRHVRRFLADYGMPMSLVVSSAMAYWGRFNAANPNTLPIGPAFKPAGGREWLVRFWQLEGKWVGIALPFGFVLWILFFFDHNVSSLMAQSSDFPLRKPPGFHWDFFLLGITTFLAGLLGLPAPNGLIPQAPIHTKSLLVMGHPLKNRDDEEDATIIGSGAQTPFPPPDADKVRVTKLSQPSLDKMISEVPISVVEQRVSNLAQGSLCLVLLTGPFLHVLNLIPRGESWYMGADALRGNGITRKIFYFLRDRKLTPEDEPLRKVRKSRILLFIAVQLVGFGATFAITQTIAAIGFPVIIMLLIPLRVFLIPQLPFTSEELVILDQPTASPFQQEYQLGQQLRRLYLDPSSSSYINGMNGTLVNDAQFRVRADAGGESGVILNSAQSLIQGLIPANSNFTTTLANGSTIEAPLNGYQTFDKSTTAFYNSKEFQEKAAEYNNFLDSLPPYLDGRPVDLQNMIYDFMNVQFIHNSSFAKDLPQGYLQIARYLADWHEYNVFSDPQVDGIGNIAGQTIIPSIVDGFKSILSDKDPVKFVYLAISYKPFISLFNMTKAAQASPELAGIVNYAAVLALEARQPASGKPVLRFNFMNDTGADFKTYPILGSTSDVLLSDFIDHLQPVGIELINDWCSVCANTQDRGCDALTLAVAESRPTISPVGAGFLGAGLTLAVALAMFAMLFFLGCLTFGGISKRKRSSKASVVSVPPIQMKQI
ncbi:hypothetical protein C0995_000173 [Termitomyces sp. Mi166|nr:hypothetical protein C0995_000173 [Termitomyces sp. Mi166\